MSHELQNLKAVHVTYETAGNFCNDYAASFPTGFLPLPYEEGSLEFSGDVKLLDPRDGGLYVDKHAKKIRGPKSCAGNLTVPMHSHGLDLNGTTPVPTIDSWALRRMLETILGGCSVDSVPGSNTTVVSATTTAITVTTGHGSRFVPGGAIACVVNGGLEVREVKTSASNVVSVKQAFSAVPATSSIVRRPVTFFLTENPDKHLQFVTEGNETDDRFQWRGMQGGLNINVALGEIAKLVFQLQGARWNKLSPAAPQAFAPSFNAIAASFADLTLPVVGNTAKVAVQASAFSFEPKITYAPITGTGGIETVVRMRRQRSDPAITGSFTCPFEDTTWFDARDNGTDLAAFLQVGNIVGETILFSAPTIQVVGVQRAASAEGIAGQTVTWEGRHDAELGLGSELTRSVLRIHCV